MQFNFRLEALLRIRRLLERQARERLDGALEHERRLKRQLAEAASWREETARQTSDRPIPAAELHFVDSVLQQTARAATQCEEQRRRTEEQADELRRIYLASRRARKTVSTLRANALHQFQLEQARREQLALDEIFLGKLIRARTPDHPAESVTNETSSDDKNLT